MPLLVSPIDGRPMTQVNRYGIEIDVCPTTGGIWLDKGELEKLVSLIEAEMHVQDTRHYPKKVKNLKDDDWDDDDGFYRYSKGHLKNRKPYKKKDKMSRIMEVFDFG